MILSILIPSIPERKDSLEFLLIELRRQIKTLHENHPTLQSVEIIIDNSKSFLNNGMSIGAKRQYLLEQATGKYLCFLDDDDTPAPNYIETIVRLLQVNPDVVTFNSICKLDNFWTLLKASINHKDEQVSPDRIIKRGYWHIHPVKSEIAKQFSFDDISHGEDVSFCLRVRPHLHIEAHTDCILTQYNHSSENSEADKIYRSI